MWTWKPKWGLNEKKHVTEKHVTETRDNHLMALEWFLIYHSSWLLDGFDTDSTLFPWTREWDRLVGSVAKVYKLISKNVTQINLLWPWMWPFCKMAVIWKTNFIKLPLFQINFIKLPLFQIQNYRSFWRTVIFYLWYRNKLCQWSFLNKLDKIFSVANIKILPGNRQ